jgi:hypothetical protein
MWKADGRTERQTDMIKLRVAFHNFMNISAVAHFVPKKKAVLLFFIIFNSKPG